MPNDPTFATIGTHADNIDVRLSYKIVELFSEGLYASPNKAIEELVANSFDAGAERVQVILSTNLHDQNASIVVIDDGEGAAYTFRDHLLSVAKSSYSIRIRPLIQRLNRVLHHPGIFGGHPGFLP